MKTNFKLLWLMAIAVCFLGVNVQGQTGVLNPNDPIVVYNPASPPAIPAANTMVKWVKTNRLNWNTSSFKCYFYNNTAFRLKFPKTYVPGNGKKYPVYIFFHGVGERGTIYDNEYQLYHGGDVHSAAVDNGKFDGYLLYIQSSTSSGSFGDPYYQVVYDIVTKYLIPEYQADENRIIVDGLSGGGQSTWEFTIKYPMLVAASLPISATSVGFTSAINSLKFTPIWQFQGGLDNNPAPGTSEYVGGQFLAAGANYKLTEYPTLGHGCWDAAWAEADYFPYMVRANKTNPWTLGGRTEFCPGDPINVTIGVTAGFDGYEWRKDGVTIATGTNTINVTTVGTYDCRIKRGTVWSDWSPTPVQIKIKTATIPPPITVAGLQSKVIPALDGSNGVTLSVPNTYAAYLWQKVGSNTTIGTANTLNATTPGDYKVQVTEQYGCSTSFSDPFTVIDANGSPKPDAAINLIVTTLSKTSLRLDWSDNPAPQYNETNFEVYQASQAGGPYTLIAIKDADVLTHTITGLNAKTKYYFKVRAVNNTGAAPASNEANGQTAEDNQPPTAPTGLNITGTSRSSISLGWNASTDDVGVTKYDVYVNGVKSYSTSDLSLTIYNLQFGQSYNFAVKARDFAGNVSPFSNQVTGQPLLNGIPYKYYTFTGTWNNLPDFTTLTPKYTGTTPNVDITVRDQEDNFSFLWEGFINIPVSGTYYFRTNSDDGSRLWLGSLNGSGSPYTFSGTPLVNNDGLHGTQNATSSAISLTAGTYPIAIAYYEQGGGQSMTISWRTPQTGTSYVTIPNSAFQDTPVVLGSAPADPSGLIATAVSYSQINLNWTDNSNNETGFEIWRSTNISTGFATVATVAANTTSYSDNGLNPSTTYYYQIRAIGQYGESNLVANTNVPEATWLFNNNYIDSSGNGHTLTQSGNPTFDGTAANKKEGTYSIKFNGTNQYATIPVSSTFLQNVYSQKTVSFWMKSSNNTGGRIIADIGGSDDGLVLQLNSSRLYAGVASNNVRRSFYVSYTSTDWNYITLVYNSNTLKLYVNGVLVGSDNSLPFTATTTTTNGSRIASNNGTNAMNTGTALFSGWIDNFVIYNSALFQSDIVNLMNGQPLAHSYATTSNLPAVPTTPSNLVATGISNSKIGISWNDATNEDSYELYRSSNTNGNYLLFKTLPANTTSFVDSGLFANAVFYYKVRAINVGGPSSYSNEDSAVTINNIPQIVAIPTQYMRYGTTKQVNVNAADVDPGTLNVQVTNLPAFASYVPTGNGTGTINFTNPSVQATYSGITITVTDAQGGTAVTSFNLVVNDNYNPVLGTVTGATVNEMQTAQINLSATDQNASDVLTWTFTGLPSFATVNTNNGSATLNLAPGYADNGPYHVGVKVDDGHNGYDTSSLNITVNDVNPNKKTYVNFTDGSLQGAAPWNNTNKVPALNDNYANLKDETGTVSGMGIQVMSPWQNIGNGTNVLGVNTGNNSGVYPDNVIRSAYYTTSAVQTLKIYGLNNSNTYNFTFFGSRAATDDRTSIYTINGNSVSLNAANNSANTVKINSLTPDPDGSLTMTLQKGASAAYGYLNAMVIESIYDDGSAPAKPRNVTAQIVSGKVRLNWVDAAYNETAYEIYRATSLTGPYALINPGGNNANLVQYDDASILGNTTYFYAIRTINSHGNSPYSDTVSIATPNVSPVLTQVADVAMKTQQVLDINVTATDDPADVITLSVTGLPSFGSFTDNGNGTGVIHLDPGSTLGTFAGITITATDNHSASSSQSLKIVVTDKDITSYYVNFNQVTPAGSPWNNFNSLPLANTTITGIKDDAGNTTGINVALIDGWDGANNVGATTGNNSGVFPDDVMSTAYFLSSTNANRIRITGLSTLNTKYNLVFFASRGGVNDNRNTTYTYNGQSVTLNAASNTSNVAQLNGVVPDANGVIEFTAQKASGSSYAYIGALVLQSYVDNGIPLAPGNLVVTAKSKSAIQLTWQDKSSNEDGFEIYRSTSYDGTYSLLYTTAANVTSYTDQGLPTNTLYYYKVRAKKLPLFYSAFTAIQGASTYSYSVSINFNRDNPQAAPWNNTNNAPMLYSVFDNLINDQSNPSGLSMTVAAPFAGDNPYGVNTGNNSGIYPDNVMRGSWWIDGGFVGAQVKISGLSQAMAYSFVFFGSRAGGSGNKVTVYTINGTSVSLDCQDNSTRTAQIDNVIPDENGEVTVTVSLGPIATYGYLGALVINGYQIASGPNNGNQSGRAMLVTGNESPVNTARTVPTSNNTSNAETVAAQNNPNSSVISKAGVFPNPFTDQFVLSADFKADQKNLVIRLMDATGRTLMSQNAGSASQGYWNYTMNVSNLYLKPGTYIVQLYSSEAKAPPIATFKVVKVK